MSPIVGKELSDTYIKVNSFRKHEIFDEKFSKSIANPNNYRKPQDLLSWLWQQWFYTSIQLMLILETLEADVRRCFLK